MKKIIAPFYVLILISASIAGESCKRNYESVSGMEETSSAENGSKSFSEIDLDIKYSYSRSNPADFKATISENFKIEQFNSLYNKEQKMLYFTLTCKDNNDNVKSMYFISGTVNVVAGETTISYSKSGF